MVDWLRLQSRMGVRLEKAACGILRRNKDRERKSYILLPVYLDESSTMEQPKQRAAGHQ